MGLYEKIRADIDVELYLLKKRIELKYDLNWAKARDVTNQAVRELMCSRRR